MDEPHRGLTMCCLELPVAEYNDPATGEAAFFEFMEAVMSWTSGVKTVCLLATRIQPMASADVAEAMAEVCVAAPLRGTRNVASPEVFTLDELGRITLDARGDQRAVVADNNAGIYAAASSDVLIARCDAVIAKTAHRDWLAR